MSFDTARRLIGYISDDIYIANYIGDGWTPARVRSLRQKSEKPPVGRMRAGHVDARSDTPAHHAGHGGNIDSNRNAIEGSRRLVRAIAQMHVNAGRHEWRVLLDG